MPESLEDYLNGLKESVNRVIYRGRETSEDVRRRIAAQRYDDYLERRNQAEIDRLESMMIPTRQQIQSDWEKEQEALDMLKSSGALAIQKSKRLRERQYYSLVLKDKREGYAYVYSSSRTSVVFVQTDSPRNPYRAFWVREDQIFELVEKRTLDMAERILNSLPSEAA